MKNQLKAYPVSTKKISLRVLTFTCLSFFAFNAVTAQKTPVKEEVKTQQLQETITVKGTVSDEEGTLPSVSILLKGTNVGTETDLEGNFQFPKKLKKGDVLVFSFMGLETQKIVIGKETNLSIFMKPDANILLGKVAVKEVYKSNKKF